MMLSEALLQLHPDAQPLRDYILQDDGFGAYIAEWHLSAPRPTAAQLQAASDAFDTAQAQAAADAAALRTQVRSVAQSAVGVVITSLTAAQVRSLLAVLLWKDGALNKDGTVKPLNTWT